MSKLRFWVYDQLLENTMLSDEEKVVIESNASTPATTDVSFAEVCNHETYSTLCVGCGANPEGTVNVDLYPNDRGQCVDNWNPKEVANFVLASADYLPFKDGVFKSVIARHVLEHLPVPIKAIEEWRRVCYGKIIIYIPSQYVEDLTPSHLYGWNIHSLRNLLRQVFGDASVNVQYTSRLYRTVNKKAVMLNLLSRMLGFYTEIVAVCDCKRQGQ